MLSIKYQVKATYDFEENVYNSRNTLKLFFISHIVDEINKKIYGGFIHKNDLFILNHQNIATSSEEVTNINYFTNSL